MMIADLPEDLARRWRQRLADWTSTESTQRLWNRDSTLWTGADEDRLLGWLEPECGDDLEGALTALQKRLDERATDHVLLLGMGGSSLGAEVIVQVLGHTLEKRTLQVLDSTDPDEVAAALDAAGRHRVLVLAASKSGTTLETALLTDMLLQRLPAESFAAITDTGSALERLATDKQFSRTYRGNPAVGGRFSVLTAFGLVPAAAVGLDVGPLVDSASAMAGACRRGAAADNPGVALGLLLAAATDFGLDKLTIFVPPELLTFGDWLEQLIAESTGKEGQGILPIVGEPVGGPEVYGSDRLFVHVADQPISSLRPELRKLSQAGHPVVGLSLSGPESLGAELYRWMFATAVLGAGLGLNPFDQPDVEAAKQETRRLVAALANGRSLAALTREQPLAEVAGLELYGQSSLTPDRTGAAAGAAAVIDGLLADPPPGSYLAILAYLPRRRGVASRLTALRQAVRDRYRIATSVGFGPRYLHSTGQLFKGGPPNGRFLVLTNEPEATLTVPGESFTLGDVKLAQALGDLRVLEDRGRPVLRGHLTGDVEVGLATLVNLIQNH